MLRALQNLLAYAGRVTETGRGLVALGLSTALVLWLVWYITKAPCTIENAQAGICNTGTLARFINHQILGQCILLGIAVAAAVGGYKEIMVSRERKRADAAEQRLAEVQEELRQERKRREERTAEARAEWERMVVERERILAERERILDEAQAEHERQEAERRAERERQDAERQADLERQEAERRAERERQEAERQADLERQEAERRAERELDRAERQAMLNTMAQISNTLAQLTADQQNGQSPPQD